MILVENIISDLKEGLSVSQISTRHSVGHQVIRRKLRYMDKEWISLSKVNGKKRQLDHRQEFNPVRKPPNS